jgi:hypothetical protein
VKPQFPDNENDQNPANTDGCSVCRELLANLERFFGMLESARRSPDREWMTVEEVARELKISKSIVYRIIRNGELAAVDITDADGHVAQKGHYRIRRSGLDQYLISKQVKPLHNHNQTRRSRPRRYPEVKDYLGL